MNLNLIKSLIPEIEEYTSSWIGRENFRVTDVVEDLNNEESYFNDAFVEILIEFLQSKTAVHYRDYQLDDSISTFTAVIQLKDGRYLEYQDYFTHDGSVSILDVYEYEELINCVREVVPVPNSAVTYKPKKGINN